MAKVLIVEDVKAMCKIFSKVLTDSGYETIIALDGTEAVRLYRSDRPDVVLMDITIPGKNGLETFEEIRQIDPDAQVIMLTALSQEPLIAEAMRLGARDYLAKPVTTDQLIATVQRVLG